MQPEKFKNALVSVSDKTGLVECLRPLVQAGLRLVSTGGTARHLREAGFTVIEVSDQTRFPEVMDGRVKTLHPYIHMALLARGGNPEDQAILQEHGLAPFDLVIGNLYPFESALADTRNEADQVEYIDVGGPSFLRAAAKSFDRITVVCDPADYSALQAGVPSLDERRKLAAKVFAHVSSYDAMISRYLGLEPGAREWTPSLKNFRKLRYGENPHQSAYWYATRGEVSGFHGAKIEQGKELSYNNLLDLDAAWAAVGDYSSPACIAVKHLNPCGAAEGSTAEEAVQKALASDPVSVFGGIVAMNRPVSEEAAAQLTKIFLECVVAPGISEGAKKLFASKQNLRVLIMPDSAPAKRDWRVRSVFGGVLVQSADAVGEWNESWKIHGQQPAPEIREDLIFAWKLCARLKSNAIAIAGNRQSLGLGMGQVNRIDAVNHAIERWRRFHPAVKQAVLASDAFFPFPDSIDRLAEAGIRWVIQPGGSVKDNEVLQRADQLGVNIVLTGERHFSH